MSRRDVSCIKGTGLLNLVFELKFLDVFMGREDPIDFFKFMIPCIIRLY